MKPAHYWISNIALDAAVASLILATVSGLSWAENLLTGLIWLVITGHAIVAIGGDKTMATSRPSAYWLYHAASECALIAGLWLAGFPLTAICYLLALIGFELALKREPRSGQQQGGVAA